MSEPIPLCAVPDCGRTGQYLVTGLHPPKSFYVEPGDWLCERDRRVAEILAERFDRTLVLEPRWANYALGVDPASP